MIAEAAARRTPGSALWLLLFAGCGGGGEEVAGPEPAEAAAPWFTEEAALRGLDFVHVSGHEERFLFPELMGGGAALFDMDGDGDLDAFLVQSGSLVSGTDANHRLFENDGEGQFTDVSERSGLSGPGYGMGVAVGDYDGDGDEDLYVTQVGANRLLRNDGGGRFEDVTREAGVGDTRWGTSAGFFDYDMDGDLDLFVTNYIDWSLETEQDCFDPTGQPDYCSPTTYSAPGRDTLFRNDGGVFVDVTEAAGLAEIYGNGLGVVFGDYDADGDLDMFVANDQMADQLWRNEGDGTFVDVGEMVGVARDPMGGVRAGMGVDAADVDDDGDLDLLVVHLAREKDGFFRNRGSHFVEETTRVGIGLGTFRMTRFGVGFHDFDGDGHLDLFVANGRVNLMMAALDELDPYAEPNTLMRGTGRGTWEVVSPAGGTVMPRMATSRGAAFGDVNGDGAPDVVVVNRDGPADLFINCAPRSGRSLTLRLEDEEGALAQGARASLSLGDRRIRRDVKPAYSYCSASDSRLHFGLGEMAEVEAVEVTWPDGSTETFGPLPAGAHVLRRGTGR